jgi:hypothetical protein
LNAPRNAHPHDGQSQYTDHQPRRQLHQPHGERTNKTTEKIEAEDVDQGEREVGAARAVSVFDQPLKCYPACCKVGHGAGAAADSWWPSTEAVRGAFAGKYYENIDADSIWDTLFSRWRPRLKRKLELILPAIEATQPSAVALAVHFGCRCTHCGLQPVYGPRFHSASLPYV